mmetsp:Transcript_6944/g.20065  ORF Transcript_6944/g.20065 Transcript_6944/m.20065 type:complete len:232 (-) Transcript_6944:68-763(-)
MDHGSSSLLICSQHRIAHAHDSRCSRACLIAASVPRRGLAGRVSQKMEVKGGLNPQGPPQPRDQVPLFCASHTLPPAAPLVVVREPAHLSRRRREVEVGEPAHFQGSAAASLLWLRRVRLMSCCGAPARSMVLLCQPAQRLGRNSSSACSGKEAGEGRRRVGRLPAAARPWTIPTSGSKGRWRGWVCRVDLAAMHCPGIGDGDLGITFRRETLARDRAEERRIVGRICGRA